RVGEQLVAADDRRLDRRRAVVERLREERNEARSLATIAGTLRIVERALERGRPLGPLAAHVRVGDELPRAREAGVVAELLQHRDRALCDADDLPRGGGRTGQRVVEAELDRRADLQSPVAGRSLLRRDERCATLREVAGGDVRAPEQDENLGVAGDEGCRTLEEVGGRLHVVARVRAPALGREQLEGATCERLLRRTELGAAPVRLLE